MKIAFDSWVLASRLRYHGTYVYAQNLIVQFKELAKLHPEIKFCLFASSEAANDANAIEPGNRFELTRTGLLAYDRLWRLGGVGVAAARARADVIFSPTPNILPVGTVPVVSTIHDAIPVLMSVSSRRVTLLLRSMTWCAANFSRAVITDSECSKRDLMSIYRLPESKVSVVYHGYDQSIFNDLPTDPDQRNNLWKKLGLVRPYLLHHGVIQPRKNLKRLIDAYRLLLSRNRNLELDLVLAGRLGWQYDEILAAANNGAPSRARVVLPGALAETDLATLIKGATLVVIPSLYEGFCLPMVEAMACRVPTIASRSSCLPEVSGGALEYFDPLSVEEMAACMEQVLENEDMQRDLVQRGKDRADTFSWQRCAKETLEVLRRQSAP